MAIFLNWNNGRIINWNGRIRIVMNVKIQKQTWAALTKCILFEVTHDAIKAIKQFHASIQYRNVKISFI